MDTKERILNVYYTTFPKESLVTKYGFVVDYGIEANNHRFFLVDNSKKDVIYSWYTSHGRGSGSFLRPTDFGNIPNSYKSSLGRIKTAETYYSSKFGYALRLDGLDKGVNDNIRKRAIVMHPATYVSKDYVYKKRYPGRSEGCITLDPAESRDIIDKLKGGSYGVSINSKG